MELLYLTTQGWFFHICCSIGDCMNKEDNMENCVCETLKVIDVLQRNVDNNLLNEGCSQPFLGNQRVKYDTRPFSLYQTNGELFRVPIDDDPLSSFATVFRLEKLEGCCATLRALLNIPNGGVDSLLTTDRFVTVNTNCFCTIRCLNDFYLNNQIVIKSYTLLKNQEVVDSGTFTRGVHVFETFDLNNEEPNPNYLIRIRLIDYTGSADLNIVNVSSNNPNFIINSATVNNDIVEINFTVQTNSAFKGQFSQLRLEQTQETGIVTFSIANGVGIIANFAFVATIVSVYP